MKLETFFEKFEMFADAPNAVAKMRELVLELAVKGALSERHASDQVYPAWREFVTKFDQRSYDSDSTVEPPFEIPTEWRWTCLDDLGTTRVRNDVENSTRVSFVPMALISSIYGVVAQSEERTWSEIKKGFTHFADGDVVMAKITPCFENAKSAVMRNLVNGVGAGTTELHVFRRGTDLVLPEFVLLYVKTRGFITRGEPRMTGSAGQKRVPREYFATSPFPLPPLAEQKRIVVKVDELMALCDRLEEQQQEREEKHKALSRASLARFADAPTPANLQFIFHPSYTIAPADLRKSILTLAVQGKLVPQDPNDEPAEILFERIQTERAEQEAKGTYKSSRPLEPIEDTEEPFELPVEWKWARLRSLVFTLGDGLHGTPEYSDGTDCYFINGNNLVDGRIVIKSHTKTVSLDEAKKHRKPMTLSTVLVSINGTLGSVAFYNNENVILGKSACYFNLASLVDKHFSRRVIESPYFVDYATANATGTTIRNLGLKAMNYFPFPLPPLDEQRRIVAKVDELMKLVDALETQLAASRATAANLLAALVAELTGTPNTAKASVPASTSTGTGRRGRPPKS